MSEIPNERDLLSAIDEALGEGDGATQTESDAVLRALRGRCIDAFPTTTSASEEFRVRRVANSVLRRTTREDLSPRGDLGLMLDFAAERLRDSAVLRVAVALLVVQLTLVPLIAYAMRRTDPPVLHLRFEDQTRVLEEELPADLGLEDLVEDTDAFEPILDPLPLPVREIHPLLDALEPVTQDALLRSSSLVLNHSLVCARRLTAALGLPFAPLLSSPQSD